MTRHIVIISTSYPSARNPGGGSFVRKLARDFIRLGITTTVITPRKVWHGKAAGEHGGKTGAIEPHVVRPRYISCSGRKIPLIGSTFPWTIRNFHAAVRKAMLQLDSPPSHIYGQFLFPAGYVAGQLSLEMECKSAVDLGESHFDHYEKQLGRQKIKQTLSDMDSVIAVADHLKNRCVDNYDVPEAKILTARNAAPAGFTPLDKSTARNLLELPQECFIIGYVGAFDANKRPLHVLGAIRERPGVKVFFLGKKGTQKPAGNQVLFTGNVPHDQVRTWLSAADIFAHTSLVEMSSNAVAEAKACGLPIVATDIPGNREALDPGYSILVDPRDRRTLSKAIFKLADNPQMRAEMSAAARESARRYTSLDRAGTILSWITS